MKNLVCTFAVMSFILLFGCEADFLKSPSKRIVGTWRISEVKLFGFGGDKSSLKFNDGSVNFLEDGSLVYINSDGTEFTGSWQITREQVEDQEKHSLLLTAVDFNGQKVLTQYYHDVTFFSSNHFKADINFATKIYVTHFRK